MHPSVYRKALLFILHNVPHKSRTADFHSLSHIYPLVGPAHSCMSFPPSPSSSFISPLFSSVPSVCNCFLSTRSSRLFLLKPRYMKKPPTAIANNSTPSRIANISPAFKPPFCCCGAGMGIVELVFVSNNCVAVTVAVCISVSLDVRFCVCVCVIVIVLLCCTVEKTVS